MIHRLSAVQDALTRFKWRRGFTRAKKNGLKLTLQAIPRHFDFMMTTKAVIECA